MNSKISDKDKKDWHDFLSSNESLPNKDLDLTGTLPSGGTKEKEELDEIENNSRTTNETETVIDDQIIQYSNTDFELPSQYVDPGDGGGGEGGATSEFDVAT